MNQYSKGQRLAALLGVLCLVILYIATLVVAFLKFEGADRLFQACLVATVGIPILLWIYLWLFKKWKER